MATKIVMLSTPVDVESDIMKPNLIMPMQKYEEIILPTKIMPAPAEKLDFIKRLPYKENDVLLSTYMKSGTTWMGNILGKLLKTENDEDDLPVGCFLESTSPEALLGLKPPRILPTHLWPRRFPSEFLKKNGKIILLLRNPKDIAVSFYFHLKQAAALAIQQTWDEFFVSYMSGGVLYGQYFDFLSEWNDVIQDSRQGKNDINVEILYYEDLKLNGLTTLKRLNEFLGCKKSDDELKEIYSGCSIDKLRKKTNKEKEGIPHFQKDKNGNSVIFRKGVIGDWKNYFTVAQNETYDRLIESYMRNSMFSFVYSE